jgi:hypothetical protein
MITAEINRVIKGVESSLDAQRHILIKRGLRSNAVLPLLYRQVDKPERSVNAALAIRLGVGSKGRV